MALTFAIEMTHYDLLVPRQNKNAEIQNHPLFANLFRLKVAAATLFSEKIKVTLFKHTLRKFNSIRLEKIMFEGICEGFCGIYQPIHV